ncbi:MAG: hypothetical protein WCT18_02235 [Patescibacteria group bacterium]
MATNEKKPTSEELKAIFQRTIAENAEIEERLFRHYEQATDDSPKMSLDELQDKIVAEGQAAKDEFVTLDKLNQALTDLDKEPDNEDKS